MKIAIVNSVAGISSKELGNFLSTPEWKVPVDKPHQSGKFDWRNVDVVFNYGCGYRGMLAKKFINTPDAVCRCVDKPTTFEAFKKAKVNTVEHTQDRNKIPKHWNWVVVRKETDGRKAEGLSFHENVEGQIPIGQLYSEYYEHRFEYRVVVFMGKVVGFYYKRRKNDGNWYFNIQKPNGFEEMGDHCIRAAKELGIDYVGFDVVAKDKKNFKILEANSAPILTTESMEAIHSYFFKE